MTAEVSADLLILDFRREPAAWRSRVSLTLERHHLRERASRWEYFEVHLYCAERSRSERSAWRQLFDDHQLWPLRFTFTHERCDDKLCAGRDRSELMLGTHFLAPRVAVPYLTDDLVALCRALDLPVERVRVERPVVGETLSARLLDDRAGWWESHIKTRRTASDVFPRVSSAAVRDISEGVGFIDGEFSGACYTNIESRDCSMTEHYARTIAIKEMLSELDPRCEAQIEEVLLDVGVAQRTSW